MPNTINRRTVLTALAAAPAGAVASIAPAHAADARAALAITEPDEAEQRLAGLLAELDQAIADRAAAIEAKDWNLAARDEAETRMKHALRDMMPVYVVTTFGAGLKARAIERMADALGYEGGHREGFTACFAPRVVRDLAAIFDPGNASHPSMAMSA